MSTETINAALTAARACAEAGGCMYNGCGARTGLDVNGLRKLVCGDCWKKTPMCATCGLRRAFAALPDCLSCDIAANADCYGPNPHYQRGASRPTPPAAVDAATAAATALVASVRADVGCARCGRRTGNDVNGERKLWCGPCWSSLPICGCGKRKVFVGMSTCATCNGL